MNKVAKSILWDLVILFFLGSCIIAICPINFLQADIRKYIVNTKTDLMLVEDHLLSYKHVNGSYPSMKRDYSLPITITKKGYISSKEILFPPPKALSNKKSFALKYYLFDDYFLLHPPGPDYEYDLSSEKVHSIFSRKNKDYNSQELSQYRYDPTNGTISSGDIMHSNLSHFNSRK